MTLLHLQMMDVSCLEIGGLTQQSLPGHNCQICAKPVYINSQKALAIKPNLKYNHRLPTLFYFNTPFNLDYLDYKTTQCKECLMKSALAIFSVTTSKGPRKMSFVISCYKILSSTPGIGKMLFVLPHFYEVKIPESVLNLVFLKATMTIDQDVLKNVSFAIANYGKSVKPVNVLTVGMKIF